MMLKSEANKCKIDAGSPEAIRTVEERGGGGGGGGVENSISKPYFSRIVA